MNTEIIVALIVLAGGGLTMLGNYLINKRQTSGSVTTSDAATLWVELNAIKDEYKDRADKYETRLEENNKVLQELTRLVSNLQAKGDKMNRKIEELKKLIAKLREENAQLLAERRK